MLNNMTTEQIESIYEMANAIYYKKIRLVDGREILFKKYGVNKNSFADYYRAFQKMLDGKLHTRAINSSLRIYFLNKIYECYGVDRLKIALDAYMESIVYYEESHNNTNRKIERDIYQRFSNLINS